MCQNNVSQIGISEKVRLNCDISKMYLLYNFLLLTISREGRGIGDTSYQMSTLFYIDLLKVYRKRSNS